MLTASRMTAGVLVGLGAVLIPVMGMSMTQHPLTAIEPRAYVSYRAGGSVAVDGHLDEPAWQRAEWTEDFTSIEGQGAAPRLRWTPILWTAGQRD